MTIRNTLDILLLYVSYRATTNYYYHPYFARHWRGDGVAHYIYQIHAPPCAGFFSCMKEYKHASPKPPEAWNGGMEKIADHLKPPSIPSETGKPPSGWTIEAAIAYTEVVWQAPNDVVVFQSDHIKHPPKKDIRDTHEFDCMAGWIPKDESNTGSAQGTKNTTQNSDRWQDAMTW